MTEAFEDEEEAGGHTCGYIPLTAQKWCIWFTPAVLFTFAANVAKMFAQMCDEFSQGFYQHGLFKQGRKADVAVVDQFREQLKTL